MNATSSRVKTIRRPNIGVIKKALRYYLWNKAYLHLLTVQEQEGIEMLHLSEGVPNYGHLPLDHMYLCVCVYMCVCVCVFQRRYVYMYVCDYVAEVWTHKYVLTNIIFSM